jgi:pilus assembly protein CpaE
VNDATRPAVEQALNDRRLEKSNIEIHGDGLDGAIACFTENSTPNVIIVEAKEDSNELLEKVDALAEVCDPGTQVVMLGNVNDIQVYRTLIQQGISEYLAPPVNAQTIFDAIAAICLDPSEPTLGRVISFMGTEGGTGSSSVAHNTAWALAKQFDEDVALLDLDLAFGTLGLAFNLESRQGIRDALSHPERLDEVLLERFMAKHDDHLFLLTSPGTFSTDADIDIDSLDVLLNLVRRTAPFVVLDVPHGWTSWTRHALTVADEVVLTATLDLASLRDTKGMYEALSTQRLNDAPVRVVLNHLGAYRKTQLSAKDFEGAVGATPALVVAHEPNLFGTAANNGQMIGDVNGRSKIVTGFEALAKTVSGREVSKKAKKTESSLFKVDLSLFKKIKGKQAPNSEKGKG